MIRRTLYLLVMTVAAACSSKHAAVPLTTADSATRRKPGDAIDSILPMAEYLKRFRVGTDSTATLAGGEVTRDALVRRFLAAVSRGDTATLASLLITRAEFAWLLFPDHRYASPPYELDPAIFWGQITAANGKGVSRLVQRHRGATLALDGLQCGRDTLQLAHGPATFWGPCSVRYRAGDSTLTRQLFGSIVERDGRMKFLSYANDF